jgi:hypothetical protein
MTKYQEFDPQYRERVDRFITDRWNQLNELERDWADKVVRYLFLTNSGGAIAVLTYMGTQPEQAESAGARWMLVLFSLGVVLVGVLSVLTAHKINWMFTNWRRDVSDFWAGAIDYEVMTRNDSARSGVHMAQYVLGYSSFLCFLGALAIGAFKLLCR